VFTKSVVLSFEFGDGICGSHSYNLCFGAHLQLGKVPKLNRVIKKFCAHDDYNTKSYKYCSKYPPPVSK
jgi:hypothetical protein